MEKSLDFLDTSKFLTPASKISHYLYLEGVRIHGTVSLTRSVTIHHRLFSSVR